ncbi:MAG: Flavodoxin [Syntrophorhabdus sp. PtaB.Bin184]|jgi:multimeric flavodoxin WrbA|nr:MAG: Flavodoxin [Syntrophorhabdus sp. PtaB.Bin184]
MTHILVTFHSQTGNTEKMAQAVAAGVARSQNARANLKKALETTAGDIRECDAVVLCSPEYFGYMSGAMKDLFDRTYEELKDDPRTRKKPYCIVISAGNDGSGAVRHIERICKGYNFKKVQNPIVCKGPVTPDILARCKELGETIAEGVSAGIF